VPRVLKVFKISKQKRLSEHFLDGINLRISHSPRLLAFCVAVAKPNTVQMCVRPGNDNSDI